MRFQDYLGQTGTTRAQFAQLIGVSKTAIGYWLSGQRVPRPEQMQKIKKATFGAVTPNDFLPAPNSHEEAAE